MSFYSAFLRTFMCGGHDDDNDEPFRMMENDNVSEKPSPPIRSGSSNSSPLWFVRRFWVNHEHSFHEGTTEHNSGYSNEASDETSTEVSDEASTEASDEASTEEDTSDHLSLASLEHRSQPTLSTIVEVNEEYGKYGGETLPPLPTTIEVDEEYEDSSESNWQPLSTTAEGRKEPKWQPQLSTIAEVYDEYEGEGESG